MAPDTPLLLFGASTRAAAFSALRAGLQPWCADLFADADLQLRCLARRIPGNLYPHVFLRLVCGEVPGPWMYTGALENFPLLVGEMARYRPLWGNRERSVSLARTPWVIADLLASSGLPYPAFHRYTGAPPPPGRWLVKPLLGAGGTGIRFWDGALPPARKRVYFQEYIPGDSCSALYLGDGSGAHLLGVTRQLVGESWLHAGAFRYCGSVGPLPVEERTHRNLEAMGRVLAQGCGLRGLFGVDFVLRDGVPWPVEVNPRYTASVEVLEYANQVPVLAWHRQVFDASPPTPNPSPTKGGGEQDLLSPPSPLVGEGGRGGEGYLSPPCVGKAILFARAALTFPADGPWRAVLERPGDLWQVPAFADIPPAGTRIDAGRPILTVFASADSVPACLERLRQSAADLDCRLFGP